jgi:thiol-disulfide isomerase/thioredoxin
MASNNATTHHQVPQLPSHEFFVNLIKKNPPSPHDPIVILKLGAHWCGPCKRVDMNYLVGLSDKIKWYECDIDENEETAQFVGIRSIPAFLAIVNGNAQPLFVSSDTMKIAEWMKGGFKPI